MKYDVVIQNPPYSKSLHLDFFKLGLNLLESNGVMTIIEPATWLVNVRKNGKASLYDEIKRKIAGHVESVVIENVNPDFDTRLYSPFSITVVDFSKSFDKIDFICCGEHKTVDSIYDCNLVGSHKLIWSVLDKCQSFGDMMKSHVTNKKMDGDWWYTKYAEISAIAGCSIAVGKKATDYNASMFWTGDSPNAYTTTLFHHFQNCVQHEPVCACDAGKHLTDRIADNVYGTKQEMENWKHFVFSNKLPRFVNICLTIDQHNNSKDFIPWLVDRQYTDEEINQMFGFTEEEAALIDSTIRKFSRQSPWFRRYMLGKNAANNEEIEKFLLF